MTEQQVGIDERNHAEKPLLVQSDGLGREIIDLRSKQHCEDEGPVVARDQPGLDTHKIMGSSFTISYSMKNKEVG